VGFRCDQPLVHGDPFIHCRSCGAFICGTCAPGGVCRRCRNPHDLDVEEAAGEEEQRVPAASDEPPRPGENRAAEILNGERERTWRVSRHLTNARAEPELYVGFLYDITDVGSGSRRRWVLHFEALELAWLQRVWKKDLSPSWTQRLVSLFGAGGEFSRIFFNLPHDDRLLLFDLHRAFVKRTYSNTDLRTITAVHFTEPPTTARRFKNMKIISMTTSIIRHTTDMHGTPTG